MLNPSSSELRIIGLGIVIASVCAIGCKHEEPKKLEPPKEVVVQGPTMVIAQVTWPKLVKCQGTLIANEITTVGSKVAGQVSDVNVDLGDTVKKNDVLVQLDQTEFKLQADQTDAQLLQARSAVGLRPGDPLEKLNPDNAPPVREARAVWDEAQQAISRLRQLSNRDTVSATDVEIAESAERVASARFSSAQNGVREKIALISVQTALRDLAHQRHSETTVRAPFGGVVESKLVASGTYVQAGQALLTLADISTVRFRGTVPERFAQQLKIGQDIKLAFDLSDQVRTIKISRIAPNLDPSNRSLSFEADIDNSDGLLRSGLFAEGIITLDPDAVGIAIPESTLVRFAGVDKVWKVIDGKVKEQA
ncbi:MAG: efflux RND transporter periplasmic adaptor subunit, partial [Pirellula sp.]